MTTAISYYNYYSHVHLTMDKKYGNSINNIYSRHLVFNLASIQYEFTKKTFCSDLLPLISSLGDTPPCYHL